MADQAQILQILLKVHADVSELQGKLNPALAATTAEVEGAAVATSELGSLFAGAIGGIAVGAVGALVTALVSIPTLIAQNNEEWRKVAEEIKKSSKDLNDQIAIWDSLARNATKFSDVISLTGKGIAELTKLSEDLEKAQQKNLTWAQKIEDAFNPGSGPHGGGGIGENRADLDAQKQAAQDTYNKGLDALIAKQDVADAAVAKEFELLSGPPTEGLKEITDELTKAEEVLASINRKAQGGEATYLDQLETVKRLREEKEKLDAASGKAYQQQNDVSLKERQAELDKRAADGEDVSVAQHKLSVEQEIAQLTKSNAEALKDGRVTQGQINQLAETQVTAEEKLASESGRHRDNHKEIAGLLAQERVTLEGIRLASESIDQNPFLRLGDKDALNLQLIPKEIANINLQIAQNKTLLSKSILDPSQTQRVVAEIKQGTAAVGQLQIKLQLAGSQTKQFQASLVAWSNSFGTVGTQLAQGLENTVGTAISGIGNAITGLIFKTKSWGQAFAEVGQAIVGQIVQIFVQLIASQIISFIVGQTIAKSAQQAAATQASTLAASWAVPATLASIATEGGASIAGDAALKLSLLSNIALATGLAAGGAAGGYARGGLTPGQTTFTTVGEEGPEYVMSAPAVRKFGAGRMEAAHRAILQGGNLADTISSSLGGGSSRSGRPKIHQHLLFLDPRELAKHIVKTPQHETSVVHISNRRGGNLRG